MEVAVAKIDEIRPGTVKRVQVGDVQLALVCVEDEVYALEGLCRHLQGPLGYGDLDGHLLRCPWHGWTYDVRTGLNDFDLAIQLTTYEARVEDGEVKVAL